MTGVLVALVVVRELHWCTGYRLWYRAPQAQFEWDMPLGQWGVDWDVGIGRLPFCPVRWARGVRAHARFVCRAIG